ncbi:hypothetical protein WJ42_27870 [Burkholderia cepacia]|uniref:hypothetical protein n=1 Tax=Burkholderia cepacia TaxID=292 RepID=UPI00075527A0|nr:hypothetical protein WJ42_27870 [Burkholderia cepacia]KWC58493.1 hypothetical protein WL55_35390 [Burkholderia cepacia]
MTRGRQALAHCANGTAGRRTLTPPCARPRSAAAPSAAHLRENLAASGLVLPDDALADLDRIAGAGTA